MGAGVCIVLLFYHLVYQNYCGPVTRARVGSSKKLVVERCQKTKDL